MISYKTGQRKSILDYLIKNKDKFVNAEEILEYMKKNKQEVGLTTIYRFLSQTATAPIYLLNLRAKVYVPFLRKNINTIIAFPNQTRIKPNILIQSLCNFLNLFFLEFKLHTL